MKVFKDIAKFYDSIYSDRDYSSEVKDIISHIPPPAKLLDIGMGTGTHSRILKDEGYKITGIEPSSQMAAIAKSKGLMSIIEAQIQEVDTYTAPKDFDIAIAMFDVFDYILEKDDWELAFFKVYKLLKTGGLFYIEGWNKDGMRENYSKFKEKKFTYKGREATRVSSISETMGSYRVDFLYLVGKEKYEEIHEMHPRLGFNNIFLQKLGFTIIDEKIDDYSVKLWLRKL